MKDVYKNGLVIGGSVADEQEMEEALWGLEITLKTRFGDGVRASSVGLGMSGNGNGRNSDERIFLSGQKSSYYRAFYASGAGLFVCSGA